MLLGEIRVLCDVLDEAELFLRFRADLKCKILHTGEHSTITIENESPGLHRAMPVQMLG